jgi:hypothetical protein
MKAMVKDRRERPSEGRTKQNREQVKGHLWEGNKEEWRVFCCNIPHCIIKCTLICFKFIHKPIM